MVDTTFEPLVSLLGQETAIYDELAGLLEQERAAMLAMAMDRLGEVVSRKETLALRIKALDESRKALARRLALTHGLCAEQMTISGLCEAAPGPVAAELRRAGLGLREAVLRCQAINDYNARAARRGLDLVGGAIRHLIDEADPTGKLYDAPRPQARGYAAAGGGGGLISRQA